MINYKFNYVYIEITNVCQFNCSFCPKTVRDKASITCEEFSLILDQIRPYTKNIYLHVLGEPLLHQDLEELLNIAYEKGFLVHITTNAALIMKKAEILSKFSNIRKINLSLHSADDVEQININIDKYLEDIFNFVNNYKNDSTTIIYRLWDTNLNKLDILNKLEKKYSVNLVNNKSPLAGIKLADKVFLSQDDIFQWPIENINSKDLCEGKCLGLKTHIAILSDGTVVPCCLDSNAVINLGNIFKTSLENILKSNKTLAITKGFRDNKAVHPMCKTCSFKNKFN